MANSFKVKFDITDYKDILPSTDEYLKHDFIINAKDFDKGNVDLCVWKKYEPSPLEINSPEFRQREATRVLKTGAWIMIKDELIWLPPNYYFALQYGNTNGEDIMFRLKRLKHVYFKIRCRNNPQCKGSFTTKNRQDGETTIAMHDALWEALSMDSGMIAAQSKTRDDAKDPVWKTVQNAWLGLPRWFKQDLCSDYASGDNIAETLKFMREANEVLGIKSRNVTLKYFPAVFNAMDGKGGVKRCILDEVLKWVECSFGDTLNNASKFIMPGFERRGMFDIFSSPPEKDSQSYREGYALWLKSDPNDLQKNGTTQSRIHRYYSNPLEGIQGAYDKWGDADANEIYDWIMAERKAADKDKKLNEIRGFPLNDEELWGSLEGGDFWSNQKGISNRKVYLLGARFKDEKSQEPIVVYGNLEWKDGIKDYIPVFRQSDKSEFDVHEARFCFSRLPSPVSEPYRNIYNPPDYVENCIGVDSVDKRYAGKRPSNFAMTNVKFRDAADSGIVKCPTMIYCNRPLPIELAYEDAIKACVFLQAMVQVESLNTKIVDYFEDRGYINWMISKIGQPRNSLIKGDAPSGKSAFMDEIVGLLDAATGIPLNAEDPKPLDSIWFYPLLEDILKFNLKDTHASDLTMSWGQSLLGIAKLLFKKGGHKHEFNDELFAALDFV